MLCHQLDEAGNLFHFFTQQEVTSYSAILNETKSLQTHLRFFLLRNATNRLDKLVKELDNEVSINEKDEHMHYNLNETCMQKYVSVPYAHVACDFLSDQMNSRQRVEASLRQLERERALLQHQSAENQRKVEIETDRKRSLENECMCQGKRSSLNIRLETPKNTSEDICCHVVY